MDLSSVSSKDVVKWYSEIGQVGLPVAAGVLAYVNKDWEGLGWLTAALVINQIAIEVSRELLGKDRPSGHTAAAFVGASFLVARYALPLNNTYVITSLVLASLVGLARISMGVHEWRNIVGGAILGGMVNLIVPSYPSVVGFSRL